MKILHEPAHGTSMCREHALFIYDEAEVSAASL